MAIGRSKIDVWQERPCHAIAPATPGSARGSLVLFFCREIYLAPVPDISSCTSVSTLHVKVMATPTNNEHLVQSEDPEHPANLIPRLCRQFYTLGKTWHG